jgi:uncharacterized damage-inducible protein DinB
MGQVPVWFERTFDLNFPAELYPNICARLRGTPARIEELLAGQTAPALTRKPSSGWSAQEHAGHLLDIEPLWLVRVDDYATGHAQLTPTDLRNTKTTQANHNARPLNQILAAFREERQTLLHRVNQLDPSLHAHSIPHPRLKTPLRLVDHLFFVAEHDDHHLAHIWELIHPADLSA